MHAYGCIYYACILHVCMYVCMHVHTGKCAVKLADPKTTRGAHVMHAVDVQACMQRRVYNCNSTRSMYIYIQAHRSKIMAIYGHGKT